MSGPTPGPAPRTVEGMPQPVDDEISLMQVAAVLLNGRRMIVGLALALAFLAGLFSITRPKQYKATLAFVPQQGSGSNVSRLASSLAGQLGISLGSPQDNLGPDFYQKLLSSRAILAPVVEARYEVDGGDNGRDSVPLLDLMGVVGDTREARVARAIQLMATGVANTSVDEQTGIVTVAVITRWPEVSYQIASALLQRVQDFNQMTRHTQAQAEREFLEGRVAEAGKQLRVAEDSLQTFLQKNRQYANSPELTFEHDRLERKVSMRQDLYTSLAQSYEQARVQEVQNTPVITILERPIVPPLREPRGTVLKTLLGLILGGMLGVGIVFARGAFHGQEDPETVALKDAWADTKRDVRRLMHWRKGA